MQGGEKNLFNCVNGIASGEQKNCEIKDFELCLQSLGSEYSECARHNGVEIFLKLYSTSFLNFVSISRHDFQMLPLLQQMFLSLHQPVTKNRSTKSKCYPKFLLLSKFEIRRGSLVFFFSFRIATVIKIFLMTFGVWWFLIFG